MVEALYEPVPLTWGLYKQRKAETPKNMSIGGDAFIKIPANYKYNNFCHLSII